MQAFCKIHKIRSYLLIALWLSVGATGANAEAIKSEFISVDGTRLHYLTSGKGDLLLFLHGFPDSSLTWTSQLKTFGKKYKAVALDLPGFNLSDKPDSIEFYKLDNISKLVQKFAKALGYQQYHLIGHDIGGQIAWKIAFNAPETISSLVIINSPHPIIFCREYTNPESAQRTMTSYISKVQSGEYSEKLYTDSNFKILKSLSFTMDDPKFFTKKMRQEYLSAWQQSGAISHMLNYYRAMQWPPNCESIDSTGEKKNYLAEHFSFQKPVLVIWGEKDSWLDKHNLMGMEDYLPKVEIRKVPTAGHQILHQQSRKVEKYLSKFLD